MEHVSGHDLERYHLGMPVDEDGNWPRLRNTCWRVRSALNGRSKPLNTYTAEQASRAGNLDLDGTPTWLAHLTPRGGTIGFAQRPDAPISHAHFAGDTGFASYSFNISIQINHGVLAEILERATGSERGRGRKSIGFPMRANGL